MYINTGICHACIPVGKKFIRLMKANSLYVNYLLNRRTCRNAGFVLVVMFLIFCGMGMSYAQDGAVADRPVTDHTGQVLPMRPLTKEMMTHGLELAVMEQAYDAVLYQVLSRFFAPGSFRIDVRMEVQFHREQPARQSPAPAERQVNGTVLPGMPYAADESLITSLQQPFGAVPALRMELKRINVMVFADTIYDAGQLELMHQLVSAAAKFEPRRGDRVMIIPQAFPRQTIEREIVIEEEIIVEEDEAADMTKEAVDKQVDIRGLVLVISSALLIFVVIYLAVALRKRYA